MSTKKQGDSLPPFFCVQGLLLAEGWGYEGDPLHLVIKNDGLPIPAENAVAFARWILRHFKEM